MIFGIRHFYCNWYQNTLLTSRYKNYHGNYDIMRMIRNFVQGLFEVIEMSGIWCVIFKKCYSLMKIQCFCWLMILVMCSLMDWPKFNANFAMTRLFSFVLDWTKELIEIHESFYNWNCYQFFSTSEVILMESVNCEHNVKTFFVS